MKRSCIFLLLGLVISLFLTACLQNTDAPQAFKASNDLKVLAVESFLADIAQNVAGDRLVVESLIPYGLDPHTLEPTPQDITRIAQSQVLIINGAGFEEWLTETLTNAGGKRLVIEASAGLTSRTQPEAESANSGGAAGEICAVPNPAQDQSQEDCAAIPTHAEGEPAHGDPHFWLDPTKAIRYVQNIREGLSQADPDGREIYAANAAAYIAQLQDLDAWIAEQVAQLPSDRRLLVTNHESFGYFADRYGFKIIGTIIPAVSTNAAPSAWQIAQLVDTIRATGVKAIFLETGTNPQLAEQIAREAGVKIIATLYTHSLSPPGGDAPTYLDMMMYNTRTIVESLR